MKKRFLAAVALSATAVVALAGCASGTSAGSGGSVTTLTHEQALTAKSAKDFGGMAGLEAAAKKEGHLNVITLPPSWANYGKIIAGFEKKYPQIKINSENPDGSSADEVTAAKSQKGQSTAPDVFDLGTAVMNQNLDLLAPYQVQNWSKVQDDWKDSTDSKWIYDYTGLMSIGYDSKVFPKGIKKLDDLLQPQFKNKVAIKGDPTQANEALSAVTMAALQSGGSVSDIQPGIDFFHKLKQAGNYLGTLPTQATVASGETPVVIQWSFNNVGWGPAAGSQGNPNWKTVVLPGTGFGSYYNQAINADAPNPAAARLWEEYLYSPEVQNLYLAAGAYPAMLPAMKKDGTVDTSVLKKVGDAPSDFVQLDADNAAKASALLTSEWAAAIG
ncbi:ABC transporter substrate-binding protein [Pseudolysinimonas sp.]|uniref:ABC transporter substrate-binding protein n=1 Tax=Pseudolysinimonas sp. TaxID=2680009 RepID=UPI003F7FCB09